MSIRVRGHASTLCVGKEIVFTHIKPLNGLPGASEWRAHRPLNAAI